MKFTVIKKEGTARRGVFETVHGTVQTPAFMNVATCGAIKGAVRGDYCWGSGKDDVLGYAGRMNSAGRYFIMLPKKTETRN